MGFKGQKVLAELKNSGLHVRVSCATTTVVCASLEKVLPLVIVQTVVAIDGALL